MFTGIPALAAAQRLHERVDPADIPPPTSIAFPRYQPFAQDDAPVELSESLSTLLSTTGRRPARLASTALAAIGLDLKADVDVQQLIPDPSFIPDFAKWDQMTLEQSQDANQSTCRPLCHGKLSPGCHVYLERKIELSYSNEDAFRTIRRVHLPMGKLPPRLGSAYEFFRRLEQLTTYWDDPTKVASLPPSPEIFVDDAAAEPSERPSNPPPEAAAELGRTQAGHQMPAALRHMLVATFVKLVAYDFGCSVNPSRTEPRLHLRSPRDSLASQRKSYCPSRCQFIFQNPQSREASRNGFTYGPVAAISCRADTNFMFPDLESAQSMDLAREVIAALLTAQHRAREGKEEERFGYGAWWTTRPRWGGGRGGPIGREVQNDDIAGDKDLPLDAGVDAGVDAGDDVPTPGPPVKKLRKNLAMYDNYRMVRPPAATWDRKVKYMSIGKQAGTDYDDIFLISSLFHHVSFLRMRVPLRLLEVLDGAPETDPTHRDWGKVQAWRTPWYDLFEAKDRIEAMRLLWSVMAYQMRADTGAAQA
ncbi:hypothetical protein LEL_01401 [Akanthomyces lecanii RCEF 1005]|uniref:Uncharacterized protein n=1 Tax=Akanthomyces lecanii RCEF 1005 TaxID=1081108 RepID=A0A162KNR9_CORDF|nr:hypothetical protein LEL_01401 [Akanthomyces lecanii RCEF 1005]